MIQPLGFELNYSIATTASMDVNYTILTATRVKRLQHTTIYVHTVCTYVRVLPSIMYVCIYLEISGTRWTNKLLQSIYVRTCIVVNGDTTWPILPTGIQVASDGCSVIVLIPSMHTPSYIRED